MRCINQTAFLNQSNFNLMSNVITYKQINFKRTFYCTDVKFIQVSDGEQLDSTIWELCDADEIDCDLLWKEGNKRLYGYL